MQLDDRQPVGADKKGREQCKNWRCTGWNEQYFGLCV